MNIFEKVTSWTRTMACTKSVFCWIQF